MDADGGDREQCEVRLQVHLDKWKKAIRESYLADTVVEKGEGQYKKDTGDGRDVIACRMRWQENWRCAARNVPKGYW